MAEFRQALALGATLAGDYRITGVLGQGGFGITYKAEDLRLNAPVAIKEYFPSELALRERGSTVVARSARDESVLAWGRAKFLEEARTLAKFRHPSIVRVSRLFEANNTAYMVLDFEMGPSLAQWRAGLGRDPTQAEADHIATRLLEAVGAVHGAGILHRDIKPANVIMRDGAEPVLIDFGAARQALSAQSRTVHAIVTPGYSPKEQYAVDLDRQGAWSDVYALGATLYFLVTGKVPPDALSRDLGEEMSTAASARGEWRPGFLAAIDRAMSVRSEDRPQSTAEWRQMLLGEIAPGAATSGTRIANDRPVVAGTASGVVDKRSATAAAQGATGARRRLSFDEIPQSVPVAPVGSTRRGGMVLTSVLLGLLALGGLGYWIGVVAPGRDATAWDRAVAANTEAAYERYVTEQPSGRHVAEAREKRQALARQAARNGGVVLAAGEAPAVSPAPVAPTPAATAPVSAPAGRSGEDSEPQPPIQPSKQANANPAPPPAASIPAPPPPPAFQPRASLPGPIADSEVARIAPSVPAAKWRLAVVAFPTDKITGFTDQPGDLATELNQLSGARLELTSLTGDAVVPRGELLQRMRSDRDLFTWSAPLIESGRHIEFTILSGAVPFGLEPADHVRWLRADGARLLEQAYIDIGTPMRVIPCGIAGGVGAWFKKEIRSPADFKGLKVRGGHLIVRALRRLEAEPVSLSANRDITAAFTENRLDANLGITPLSGIFLVQPRIANVYHYPGVHGPSYLFELLIGPETWAALAEPQRRLVDEACRRNLDRWAQGFASSQNDVLNRIRTQRIIVRPFTSPVREALRKAVDETLAEEAAKSQRFKDILESYNRFRR